MTALLALIRKDLILFCSDRRALLLTLVMPIVLGAFLGAMFGGSGKSSSSPIEIALIDQDNSKTSQKIGAAIKADSSLKLLELPLAEAQERIRKGKLTLAVVIPAGFGKAAGSAFFSAAAKPDLPIYYDPSRAAALGMVRGILTQHVMQTVSAEAFSSSDSSIVDSGLAQIDGQGTEVDGLRDMLQSVKKYQQNPLPAQAGSSAQAGGLSVPFATKEEALTGGPSFNGYGHSFAGMGVQFILMMSIDIGVGILLARQTGIWGRLLAAPVSLNTILAARALSGAVIALVLMCVIFAVAVLAFQVALSNPLGFVGVAACFAIMTSAFGLLIAAFGKTPEAARGIAVFATLIMVMLGGAWVPSFLFPQWMQSITLFVPTRWAIDGISGMTWRGLGMDAALESMGVLLLFAVVFGVLAFWKFHRDDRQKS